MMRESRLAGQASLAVSHLAAHAAPTCETGVGARYTHGTAALVRSHLVCMLKGCNGLRPEVVHRGHKQVVQPEPQPCVCMVMAGSQQAKLSQRAVQPALPKYRSGTF